LEKPILDRFLIVEHITCDSTIFLSWRRTARASLFNLLNDFIVRGHMLTELDQAGWVIVDFEVLGLIHAGLAEGEELAEVR
jgi:hypothetical protein